MGRPRKNGEKISLYLDKEIMDRMREIAAEKGQTLTVAIERALKDFVDNSAGISMEDKAE